MPGFCSPIAFSLGCNITIQEPVSDRPCRGFRVSCGPVWRSVSRSLRSGDTAGDAVGVVVGVWVGVALTDAVGDAVGVAVRVAVGR